MHRVTWVVVDDHGGDAVAAGLPAPDLVVAADAGLHLVERLGLAADAVVGDLDSVRDDALSRARAEGAVVERHDRDKDATDLVLALRLAASRTAADGEVVVLGGSGGRLDHALANLRALLAPELAPRTVRGRLGPTDVHLVRPGERHEMGIDVARTVTVLPAAGDAHGVRLAGCRWSLQDATLPAWSSRGVSNEVVDPPVVVAVRQGPLFVVVPPPDVD